MAVDYAKLKEENVIRYGTDIGRIGGMLLANRYDKRTHFIFELLQNAEDALRRRAGWAGSRAVTFALTAGELRVSHFGQPFDEADVRGICGIDESTKNRDITAIGRFGIGFKSVYAFTDLPEVHSGSEAFAIKSYVWPIEARARDRALDETVIILPLRLKDQAGPHEIALGLENLGARPLLFLRNVKEISWRADGGVSGLYFREEAQQLGDHVREVVLMGEQEGREDVEERWLVFSREVSHDGAPVGHVEIAFALSARKLLEHRSVRALAESPLVVFFPTVLPTHLGFLMQGPYRTTPSRDNVPPDDAWNQYLVTESGHLLLEALRWLAARHQLTTSVLKCLPLDREKFSSGLLATLFETVKDALKSEPLLPCIGRSYAPASNVRLSRTQELRELFEPTQLADLYQSKAPLQWLSEGITADRTPELRQYLLAELGVPEVTPESLLPRLTSSFLEQQPDAWIVKLYTFLSNVPSLVPRLDRVPLLRLESGSHVRATIRGERQAFLPSQNRTGFPTVRRAVCADPQARKFLQSLGLTEPDPVDDVIRNLLPRYEAGEADPATYNADMARILRAFGTDSKIQKEKLVTSLATTAFVRTTDLGDGSSHLDVPSSLYVTAGRLKDLFSGISGVRIVDDTQACLRGEEVRDLLEACGATRYIYPLSITPDLRWDEKLKLRRDGGCEDYTAEYPVQDYTLRGLDKLLRQLPTLDRATRAAKSAMLWECLIELEDRRGHAVFNALYRWKYVQHRSVTFDSAFVRLLNTTAWVAGNDGELHRPSDVLFDTLGWRTSFFLPTKIYFKSPVVEELAREAGFEPEVLDLLKQLGLTSVAELKSRLQVEEGKGREVEPVPEPQLTSDEQGSRTTSSLSGTGGAGQQPASGASHGAPANNYVAGQRQTGDRLDGARAGSIASQDQEPWPRQPSHNREFISYVAVQPEVDHARDPDGLEPGERLRLEAVAIDLIRHREPELEAMPTGNPGFDLLGSDASGEAARWVEVKAMTGSMRDRPVGLSSAQFQLALQQGERYWLYVVEHADNPAHARIVKIQNPAGRAATFTYDRGWVAIADIDDLLEKAS
ncbi:DUF3883 domain-containing protein [Bradyrhizobium sp. ORS 86]|uniref:DUF3883 domain-containing protein n=1 Tax=Bradyrhizobium sp. ORS 86 TaxID=1685970 RepID=UPI00388D8FB0